MIRSCRVDSVAIVCARLAMRTTQNRVSVASKMTGYSTHEAREESRVIAMRPTPLGRMTEGAPLPMDGLRGNRARAQHSVLMKRREVTSQTYQSRPKRTQVLDVHQTDEKRHGKHPENGESPMEVGFRIRSSAWQDRSMHVPDTKLDDPVFDKLNQWSAQRLRHRKHGHVPLP